MNPIKVNKAFALDATPLMIVVTGSGIAASFYRTESLLPSELRTARFRFPGKASNQVGQRGSANSARDASYRQGQPIQNSCSEAKSRARCVRIAHQLRVFGKTDCPGWER